MYFKLFFVNFIPYVISLSPILFFSDQEDIGADTGIADENKAILEKVRLSTRQEYIQGGGATSSVRASDRLMRELRDIYRSQNFKDGESLSL